MEARGRGVFAARRQRCPARTVDRAARHHGGDQRARGDHSPAGFIAEKLVTGEADVAIQQISELKQIGGIEVVGPLPLDLQAPAVFSAGRMTASRKVDAADHLLHHLASTAVWPVLRETGLEP
ncbi:substrate-binding domain-containing protein [Bradyrhizobium sp. ORS 86]|uniref:substrate-binding domain-containing protein n=1 Tax=Bradyrhizobium sp. ORS 86 TaxID=1685970 RepID=UPI00388F9FF7